LGIFKVIPSYIGCYAQQLLARMFPKKDIYFKLSGCVIDLSFSHLKRT